MTQDTRTPAAATAPPPRPPAPGAPVRVLRAIGWLCIAAGALVGLYLVYSLLFTNLRTEAAQSDLSRQWEQAVGDVEEWDLRVGATSSPAGDAPADGPADGPVDAPAGAPAPVDPGGAVAVLQFARPGAAEPVVTADPLFVVDDVGVDDLKRGPGHYPTTGLPGRPGNFAVAGHRSTYGAPFFNLDELVPGDEVAVTDRDGARFTYRVVEQRIVTPSDSTVLGPDPLGTGRPTLTLTTCHPRFSAAQRLIVFAELVT